MLARSMEAARALRDELTEAQVRRGTLHFKCFPPGGPFIISSLSLCVPEGGGAGGGGAGAGGRGGGDGDAAVGAAGFR